MNGSNAFLRIAAWSGIVAPILFAVLVGVESALRPGYSQITNNVSELGLGPYSIIQNVNFIMFGLLAIMFAFGLGAVIPRGQRSSRWAKWLAVLFGVGITFAGITLLSAGSAANSSAVGGHDLASFIAFFAIIATQLLIWRALRSGDSSPWKAYRIYSLASGLLSLAMLIVFVYLSSSSDHGFAERLFIAVPWIWVGVSGTKIRSFSKSPM